MINLVKRENYDSEEEYLIAYKQMLKDLEAYNKCHTLPEYNPNYINEFLNTAGLV